MIEARDKNNVYAYNRKHEVIHVSEAESGRKGYFCMGCEKELQAVKSIKENRISYFRHDPKNVGGNKVCTFSDETYRHKIAKEVLERIKKVKVPAVYKDPPKGAEGISKLLEEAKFIEAASVRTERYFYENENCEVVWCDYNASIDKYLLIKPDVTFFDQQGFPILNIEIVATHKVPIEKLIKIKRLGIDTIQILIPRVSPDEIEKTFSRTDRTKWVYNKKQEYAEYLSIPLSDTTGVFPSDEIQRKFFEETYECRAAQINNLIRSIERCLESKPYREIESANRSELSRVTRNTDDHRGRLFRIQERHREIIEEKYRERIEGIRNNKSKLLAEKDRYEKHFATLEERYLRKRSELEEKDRLFESRIAEEIRNYTGGGETFERRRKELANEEKRIDASIERERETIKNIKTNTEQLPEEFKRLEESTTRIFDRDRKSEESEIERIQGDYEKLQAEFEEKGRELDKRFEGIQAEIIRSIKDRDVKSDTGFSRELNDFIKAGALLNDLKEAYCNLRRVRRAWESLRSGAYKNWND
jgi:hypothetical protein